MNAFAETSYYVGLLNPRDHLHQRVRAMAAKPLQQIYTSDFILLELANFHTKPADRQNFISFINLIRIHQQTVILSVSTTWFQRGINFFAKRPDKEWSLTDCISGNDDRPRSQSRPHG